MDDRTRGVRDTLPSPAERRGAKPGQGTHRDPTLSHATGCPACGAELVTRGRGPAPAYCSQTCRSFAYRQRRIADGRTAVKPRPKAKLEPKPCERCGEDFTPTRVDARYCGSACRSQAFGKRRVADGRNKAARRRQNDKRRADPTLLHPCTCDECGSEFRSWSQVARFCSVACDSARRSREMKGKAFGSGIVESCRACGRTRPLTGWRCRLCNLAARKIPHRRGNAVWYAGPCLRCGTPFTTNQPQQRCCSGVCGERLQSSIKASRRRARKRQLPNERIVPIDVFRDEGYRCGICGTQTDHTKQTPHPLAPTLDHIVPLSRGGHHVRANVRCACFACNVRKGSRLDSESA